MSESVPRRRLEGPRVGIRKQGEPGQQLLALRPEQPERGREPALPRQKKEQELALKRGPPQRRR